MPAATNAAVIANQPRAALREATGATENEARTVLPSPTSARVASTCSRCAGDSSPTRNDGIGSDCHRP